MNEQGVVITKQELLQQLSDDLAAAKEDAREMGDEIQGFVTWNTEGDELVSFRVYTRVTRDASKAYNGGDYNYFTVYRVFMDAIEADQRWSADVDPRDQWPLMVYEGTDSKQIFSDLVETVDKWIDE